MEWKVFRKDDFIPYEKILQLIHQAFKERLDDNIRFLCATFSVNDLKEATKNGIIITLWDDDTIIGCVTLNFKEKKGVKYGSQDYLAVHPSYKRIGIGKMLLDKLVQVANQYNLPFITSTTSEKAQSSVKWHKKNGFKIFLYSSYADTNYYSYWFVKPLKTNLFLLFLFSLRKPIFGVSWIVCKITKDENGKKRFRRLKHD
jgi:ribosomal protein S18 acetylase RimI-like enzyme